MSPEEKQGAFGATEDTHNVPCPPPPPPKSASPPRILVIGAGSRGQTYAKAVTQCSNGVVAAVAEPIEYKRLLLGRSFISGFSSSSPPPLGSAFASWKDFIAYERDRRARAAQGEDVPPGVDAVFVCVLDEHHREVVIALAELGGLHIMCEKPLATSLRDCVDMYRALRDSEGVNVFSIGHVLRYSPHNILLRRLVLEERAIGDVLSVNHTEPVGWWHFTHSYVRGNWRRESTTAPSLLTKSCHDIDVLLWLLCSPRVCADANARPHLPSVVSSQGSLQYFKSSRKPVAAKEATNCFSCPVESDCKYSANRVYLSDKLRGLGTGNTHWPMHIVLPEIEDLGKKDMKAAEAAVRNKLMEDYDDSTPDSEIAKRNWFGRCVFESDNDVCDEQVVVMSWEEDPLPLPLPLPPSSSESSSSSPVADALHHRGAKTATFHMTAHTKKQCDRFTYIYGVDGEIHADSHTITVEDYRTGLQAVYHPKVESLGHGGGDNGLARQFVLAVDKVKNHGWTAERAQREIIACTLEEVLRSHAMVFCAEEARTSKKVLDWEEWWAKAVEGVLEK